MIIKGFQKTRLLDFPGHVASTVFTAGCNFRCPFCHNASLVLHPNGNDVFSEKEILSQLNKRKNLLDGVCVTGGEPLLQPDLDLFLGEIKAMGLKIKLDTNGSNPKRLQKLIDQKLIDAVAMDIKNCKEKYAQTCGLTHEPEEIEESIDLLMASDLSYYEFRTTVVKEFHTKEDLEKIAKRLRGCKHYFLQSFQDSGDLIEGGLSAYSPGEMQELLSAVRQYIPHAALRGTDESTNI